MKKLIVATGLLAALVVSPAFAADLKAPVYKAPPPPPPPVYTWTGCYIGPNIGWARAETKVTVDGFAEGSLSRDGFAWGGQVGCDYQFAGNWVIGIQGIFDGLSSNNDNDHVSILFPDLRWHNKSSWFATVTGRIGFLATPQFLLYAKGGWGWVNHRIELVDTLTGFAVTGAANNNNRNGPDVGAGFEWMFTQNWSLWVEWDHIFLKNRDFVFDGCFDGCVDNVHIKRNFDKVLVGVNWRFGGGAAGPVRAAY
jgi:outer membrane immunogenic protein